MWLVVGLGNPGKQHETTRHNAGFMLIDQVALSWGVDLHRQIYKAQIAIARIKHEKAMLVKPLTYMNLSGQSVKAIMTARNLSLDKLIVVYDDLDLPAGFIRIRTKGSPGTHNGMRSIVRELGSNEFTRIRIGIGPLPADADPALFVLSPFKKEEIPLLEQGLDKAEEALGLILDKKTTLAMTRFNRHFRQREDFPVKRSI